MAVIPSYLQHGEISEVLFCREQVEARVKELGRVITEHYKPILGGQPLIVVAILKGSFMFFSDLVKELDLDLTTEFMILKVWQPAMGIFSWVCIVRVSLHVGVTLAAELHWH
jgi:hypoxanthine phosphoribosyltransferase